MLPSFQFVEEKQSFMLLQIFYYVSYWLQLSASRRLRLFAIVNYCHKMSTSIKVNCISVPPSIDDVFGSGFRGFLLQNVIHSVSYLNPLHPQYVLYTSKNSIACKTTTWLRSRNVLRKVPGRLIDPKYVSPKFMFTHSLIRLSVQAKTAYIFAHIHICLSTYNIEYSISSESLTSQL